MKIVLLKGLLLGILITTTHTVFAKSYVFGVVIEPISSSESVPGRKNAFEHFIHALSQQWHQSVVLQTFTDSRALVDSINEGKVDIAFLKAISYGTAKSDNLNIQGLVTIVSQNDNEEDVAHSGYIVALASSKINNLSALKHKRFGFIKNSASGSIYPAAFLKENGINFEKDFSSHACFDNQYELIQAIKDGQIDAGMTFRPPHLKRNKDINNFTVIARINNIPNPVIAASTSLPENKRIQLESALLHLPAKAFGGLRFYGVKKIDEKLYQPVIELPQQQRDMCQF